jgi:hypothetical protein
MWTSFNRFELNITKAQVLATWHPGAMDDDIAALAKVPRIARQLKKLDPEQVRLELAGYGAWNDDDLQDHAQNLQRVLWLGVCDIWEELP